MFWTSLTGTGFFIDCGRGFHALALTRQLGLVTQTTENGYRGCESPLGNRETSLAEPDQDLLQLRSVAS